MRLLSSTAPTSVIFIRLVVGWVFLSEGIQQFLFPATLGAGRFTEIGIPDPQIMAPFGGVVEILFGALLVFGLLFVLIVGAGHLSLDFPLQRTRAK